MAFTNGSGSNGRLAAAERRGDGVNLIRSFASGHIGQVVELILDDDQRIAGRIESTDDDRMVLSVLASNSMAVVAHADVRFATAP